MCHTTYARPAMAEAAAATTNTDDDVNIVNTRPRYRSRAASVPTVLSRHQDVCDCAIINYGMRVSSPMNNVTPPSRFDACRAPMWINEEKEEEEADHEEVTSPHTVWILLRTMPPKLRPVVLPVAHKGRD